MTEHSPAQPADQPEQKPMFTRRDFIHWGAIGLAGAPVFGAVLFGGRPAYEYLEKYVGHEDTQKLFHETLLSSPKLVEYDGLLQIDPSVKVSTGIFGKAAERTDWPPDQFIVAVRPIGVRGTILRNIADHNSTTQSHVDRVLPQISPDLLAFWQPGPGKLVYLDAEKNAGLITPLDSEPLDFANNAHIPMSNVDIDGREIRGNVIYPYTNELYINYRKRNHPKAEDDYYFIGHSAAVASVDGLNVLADNYFFDGPDPIAFPKP